MKILEIKNENIASQLKRKLSRFNPNYPRILEGAWKAFYSDNPDKYRQSICSIRELFRMVLHKLTENKNFVDGEKNSYGKPTRKARLEKILPSKSKVAFVEKLVSMGDMLYNAQSQNLHVENPDEGYCELILTTTEAALKYLLDHVGSNNLKSER